MMNRFFAPTLTAVALIAGTALVAGQGPALAQQAAGEALQVAEVAPGLQSPEVGQLELIGIDVTDQAGRHVGELSNVLIDDDGQVVAVIVRHGGIFGIAGQDVAVPFDSVRLPDLTAELPEDQRRVMVDMTEEQITDLPEYEGYN
ncbi:MAG: PRC-barrel domain containing protein [Rhodospirillales bacterium]|nr:MAG: PRC-barrel domain containing protein [Rhodospirillales bacterium]